MVRSILRSMPSFARETFARETIGRKAWRERHEIISTVGETYAVYGGLAWIVGACLCFTETAIENGQCAPSLLPVHKASS